MAKSKQPAKSKAQAIRDAIEKLQGEGRDVTTSAVLSLLPGMGMPNAKATDVYQSDPWKELREQEKAGPAAKATPKPQEDAPAAQGITKGEAVRQGLATLGNDAKPKDVIAHVKKQHGLDVSYQTVLNVRGAQGSETAGEKRRGRPAKIETVVVAVVSPQPAKKSTASDISLEDIRTVKELTERLGVEQVRQLSDILS